MRILIDENIPQGYESFSPHGEVSLFHGRKLTRKDLDGVDALIIRSITRVDSALLEGTPVRFVGTATIGTEHVDLPYLASRGIHFTASPGCNAESVAQYVTAALLTLHIEQGVQLQGTTLGVIGYGNVGRRVAAKAEALGMRVLCNDPPLANLTQADTPTFHPLDQLQDEADVISLHVPLNREGPHATANLVGPEFLERLSKPVILLNTCRGAVVDEAALMAAKRTGRVGPLVFDVFRNEPEISLELAAMAEIITPHIAGYSIHGKLNGTRKVLKAFRACFGFDPASDIKLPSPKYPIVECETPSFASSLELARHCVMQVYDIRADDRNLRDSLMQPDRMARFDGLRKTYGIRHEFEDFTVPGDCADPVALQLLSALGFRIGSRTGSR